MNGKHYPNLQRAVRRARDRMEKYDSPDTELEGIELARTFDWRECAAESRRIISLEFPSNTP
jgi:hypothetical protein